MSLEAFFSQDLSPPLQTDGKTKRMSKGMWLAVAPMQMRAVEGLLKLLQIILEGWARWMRLEET